MKKYLFGKICFTFLLGGCVVNASLTDSVSASELPGKAYLDRGQEVTRLFDEYERELDLIFEYLAERVRIIDPAIYRDLQAAQQAKEKNGYQVIPRILPKSKKQPTRKKRPKPNYFNWPICERAIQEELVKLHDVNVVISSRSVAAGVSERDFLVEQARHFIVLKKTWRKIQRWIKYNRVWQGKVASGRYERWYRDRTEMINQLILRYDLQELLDVQDDKLFFEKVVAIDEFDSDVVREELETRIREKIKSIDYAIWTRTKFNKLPAYVKLVKLSRTKTEFTVPLYTDIVDEEFLSRFTEIIESNWQAKIENHQYQVRVDLRRISPADLYSSDRVPENGEEIDENDHAARFPKGAALTTGGRTTHSIGSVILLGPKEIRETTLAHEFGHELAFRDRYFRGYADLGNDGYDLFEVGTNPNDIMSNPGSGEVLPQHFREIMDAELGLNLTAVQYVNLSQQHYRDGDYEKCIATSEQALDLDPGNSAAYNNICVANIRLKQWDTAISACEKAISINPNSQLARNNLAWAKNETNRSASEHVQW